MIGAVVPVYNRRDNLELLLASLERQSHTGFHVVIADDGSTDGSRELVEELARSTAWNGRLRWVCCGPNRGVRTGRARNIGAANLEPESRLLVMLDSDLVLQPHAIAGFAAAHADHPDDVLLGPVEWLPPLEPCTVLAAVTKGNLEKLRKRVPRQQPLRVEGTFTGPELREGLLNLAAGQAVPLRPEWALPLNSAWPVDLYWKIGGFDESMCGYGYQDIEFGARAARAGARCLPRPALWALHVWHSKPANSMVENQRNLDFYLRQHGPNPIAETEIDWTLWWHYHAERGGAVVSHNGRLWALNGTRDRRLALPSLSWVRRLGHCDHVIGDASPEVLAAAKACGVAYDAASL